MPLPLEITFRNMDASEALEARIREKAAKLERYADRIQSCRVTIEAPHRHQHQGKQYQVRIVLGTPDRELVVSREPGDQKAHEDAYVAVRDAFDALQRQLEDYMQHLRGEVKAH